MLRTPLSCLLLCCLCACEAADDPLCETEAEIEAELERATPEALVHASAWRPASHDPLPAHRPAEVVCPADAWGEEFGLFEASTDTCNYLSVEQPLAAGIERGDLLRVTLWWGALIAPEPATGHLALFVDGELLWELEVEIPGSAAAHELEFSSPLQAPAGAPVVFHLHNHGQNSWTLASVERVAASTEACR